jgi:predicted nucleotide-binding protein (sugar kinase/HSP70/actin superfamily)
VASGAGDSPSAFRGFGIGALDLASRSERCGICPNDCRLRIVGVGDEEVAYGFLCGRDYATKRFVREGSGGDLLKLRSRAILAAYGEAREGAFPRLGYPTIGIPTSLYLADDAPFWKSFFEILGFPTLLAEDDASALREGKRLAGAEFCAPMAMFHGQARALLEAADFAFLPIYLEERPAKFNGGARGDVRRYYCNYSQYASVVARCAESKDRVRILSPMLQGRHGDTSMAMREVWKSLHVALAPWGIKPPSERVCREAYAVCLEAKAKAREKIRSIFAGHAEGSDIGVVLVGRPYAVLSGAMGASIGEMIAKRGIDLAYGDMLPAGGSGGIDPPLRARGRGDGSSGPRIPRDTDRRLREGQWKRERLPRGLRSLPHHPDGTEG